MHTNGFTPGLAGVVAAETRLSHVDGEAGRLLIGGYPLETLAPHAAFEEVAYLLWYGRRPSASETAAFRAELGAQRALPEAALTLLRTAAAREVPVMDALRMVAAVLDIDSRHHTPELLAPRLLARLPVAVATYWRLRQGEAPLPPDPALSTAADYLRLLRGVPAPTTAVRALETYLITVVDHGLNASTFAARVIIATRSDLTSAVTGALGALKGPLHGGAPGPALNMVFDIGRAERAEPYLRAKLDAGERLMGFGHRVYKVYDPRAAVLAAAAEALFAADGDTALYALAREVEATAIRLLDEYKPGRRLRTNVEFYTALLLHGLGFETELFTPTFAVARTAGWIGHCLEQLATGRLIRPSSTYVGPVHERWDA